MDLIKINLYGEGYYSGKTYEETIFLLEEDYLKFDENLNGKEVCLGELDGKHSEVYGTIEVTKIPKDDLEKYNFAVENDGYDLYCTLDEYCDEDIKELITRANEFISKIDSMVIVSLKVKKSQVELLKSMVNKMLEKQF